MSRLRRPPELKKLLDEATHGEKEPATFVLRMMFTLMADGTVLLRVKNKSVMSLAGSLRRKGQKPLPVEDLSRC